MQTNQDVIVNLVDYIEEHLTEELNLDRLASQAGYSKFHLTRMFAEEAGCTIHQYIQKRRLTQAADQLVNSNLPLVEIAFNAGYATQQSFTCAFKRLYFLTPQVFRSRGSFHPAQTRWQPHARLFCGVAA